MKDKINHYQSKSYTKTTLETGPAGTEDRFFVGVFHDRSPPPGCPFSEMHVRTEGPHGYTQLVLSLKQAKQIKRVLDKHFGQSTGRKTKV